MQYYNGAWTYHPQVKLGLYSLTATRDLIEQSVRTQLLALKPNVSIRGGAIAEELMWNDSMTTVQGERCSTWTDVVQEWASHRAEGPRPAAGAPSAASL